MLAKNSGMPKFGITNNFPFVLFIVQTLVRIRNHIYTLGLGLKILQQFWDWVINRNSRSTHRIDINFFFIDRSFNEQNMNKNKQINQSINQSISK